MANVTRNGKTLKTRSGGKTVQIASKGGVDLALKRTDVKDWDDDELQYGRRRDKNGRLVGRPPSYIPKACHDELVRRMHHKAETIMREAIPEVLPELIEIAKGKKASRPDQIRAINMLMERVLGKPIEHVQVSAAEPPWQSVLMDAIVGSAEQLPDGIIDVEPIEEDDPDEEEFAWEE